MEVNNDSFHDIKNDHTILEILISMKADIDRKINQIEMYLLARTKKDYMEAIEKVKEIERENNDLKGKNSNIRD